MWGTTQQEAQWLGLLLAILKSGLFISLKMMLEFKEEWRQDYLCLWCEKRLRDPQCSSWLYSLYIYCPKPWSCPHLHPCSGAIRKGLYPSSLLNKQSCLAWVPWEDFGPLGGAEGSRAGLPSYGQERRMYHALPCHLPPFDAREITGRFKPQEFPRGIWWFILSSLCSRFMLQSHFCAVLLPNTTHTQTHTAPSMAKSRMYLLESPQKIHFSFIIIFPQAKQLMAGLEENIHLCFQVIGCRFARLNPFKNPESHPFSP